MKKSLVLTLIILSSSLLIVSTMSKSPIKQVNYDEYKAVNTPLLPFMKTLFYTYLIHEKGYVVNYTISQHLIRIVPIPPSLKYRLTSLSKYLFNFNNTCNSILNNIDRMETCIKEGNLTGAYEFIKITNILFENATITLLKIKIVVDDISRTFPQVRDLIRNRISALEDRLNSLKTRFNSLVEQLKYLRNTYLSRIKTIINATIIPNIVYPYENVKIIGTLLSQNGEPIANSSIQIIISNTIFKIARTNNEGVFYTTFKAPLIPGIHTVIIKFTPSNLTYKPSYCILNLKVKPFKSAIKILEFNKTIYPLQYLTVKGEIISPINETYGKVYIIIGNVKFTFIIHGTNFTIRIPIPYYFDKGYYKVYLRYTPLVKYLLPASTSFKIKVLNPEEKIKLDVFYPSIVIPLKNIDLYVTPHTSISCNVTLLVQLLSSNGSAIYTVTIKSKANENTKVIIKIPFDIPSNMYHVKIIAIPDSYKVQYTYKEVSLYIINIYSLLIVATILITSSLLVSRFYRREVREVRRPKIVLVEKPTIKVKREEIKEIRQLKIEKGTMREALSLLEKILAKIFRIELKPSMTHREFCRKIALKNGLIASLLFNIIVLFEKFYYGLKELTYFEVLLMKSIYDKLIKILKEVKK